jgi:WD40 repeat protein
MFQLMNSILTKVFLDAKRMCVVIAPAGLAMSMFLSWTAPTQAQIPTVYSPVIVYREAFGRSFEMKEDGSAKQYLSQCPANAPCGDLSREGVQGQRLFIRIESPSVAGQSNDIVVYSEDFSSRTVLLNDKSFHPAASNGAVWSLDGNRIGYYEYWCSLSDANNQCLENRSGIVVADVVRDSTSKPVALVNERRIAEVTSPDSLTVPTWAPDNQHLGYNLGRSFSTGTIYHSYLVTVPPPASSDSITTIEISFSGGINLNSNTLNFSPASSNDSDNHQIFTLGLRRLTESRPYARFDIFTVEVPAAYDGSYALSLRRITNSTNAKNFYGGGFFDWSPDGQWLVYNASNGNISAPYDIYKIKADGGAKAINLTNLKTNTAYLVSSWRK